MSKNTVLLTIFTIASIASFMYLSESYHIHAASNNTLSFQTKIVNADGTNITNGSPACIVAGNSNDTCDFRFSIYSDPSGGTLLWQETQSVELGQTNGIFNVQLNSICNSWTSCGGAGLNWGSDSTVYIEVEFDTDGNGDFLGAEVFSRKLLTSVPYAYYADSAGSVIGGFDSVYTSDTDKLLNINDTAGFEIVVNNTGNLLFDLQSSGEIEFQDNDSTFLTLDNLGGFNYSLDSIDNPSFNVNNLGTGVFKVADETADTSPFVINQLGNVGIGTDSPARKLDLQDNAGDFIFSIRNFNATDLAEGLIIQLGPVVPNFENDFVEFRNGNGTRIGSIEGNANGGVLYTTGGADYAELFPGNYSSFGAGDILRIDSFGNVQLATHTDVVTGIYSSNPAVLGNWEHDWRTSGNFVPVALVGQIPVKVSTENGNIQIGDLITVSSVNGVGCKSQGQELIIGIALESFSGPGVGTILVNVDLTYYTGVLELDDIYASDSDKVLNVNNSLGYEILSSTSGNITIDLASTGDFTLQDNNSTFLTIDDMGNFDYTLDASDNTSFIINNIGAGLFRINDQTSDTSPFVIDANGNVGIGNASPTGRLDIVNNGAGNGIIVSSDNIGTAINILYTGAVSTTNALTIANSSSGSIDTAINLSDPEIINALNLGNNNIVSTNGNAVNWNDTVGNNLLTLNDLSTTFGASVEAGAFIDRNSYVGEEFSRERADVTADTAQGWGDYQQFNVDENNNCTFSTVDDEVNGIGRIAANAGGAQDCLAYHGNATGNAHLIFNAQNLPVVVMKVRPSFASNNQNFYIGLGTDAGGTSGIPANGIFFTNNAGTTWSAATSIGGVSSTVDCTSTVSTTTFTLLKFEVISTTEIRFYMDTNLTDGVSWTLCGTLTTAPLVNLTSMLKVSTTGGGTRNLDIDYFRIWQDDNIDELAKVEEIIDEMDEETTVIPNSQEDILNSTHSDDNLSLDSTYTFHYASLFNSKNEVLILQQNETYKSLELTFESISLNGSILLNGSVESVGDLKVKNNLQVDSDITFSSNDTSGVGTISAGQSEVRINFSKVKPVTPFVFLTLLDDNDGNYSYTIVNKDPTGFTIKLNAVAQVDLNFEWLIILKNVNN